MEPTVPRGGPDPDHKPTPEQVANLLRFLLGDAEHDMKKMPPIALPARLIQVFYVLVCMSYLPMWQSEMFAGGVLLLSAVIWMMTLRSFWVIGVTAVPSFFLVGMTGKMAIAALPIAILSIVAYGAFLLLTTHASPWLLTIPAIAFGLGFWMTGRVFPALWVLLPLPAAVVLAYALNEGMFRVRAVCRVAMALILPLLVMMLGFLLRDGGVEALLHLSDTVSSARNALAEWLAAWKTGTGEDVGRVVREGMETVLAGTIFNILPGFVLAAMAVLAYFADLICLTLFHAYERIEYLSQRVWVFAVSLPSALVFLASYLLLLLLDGGQSGGLQFTAVVGENLYIVLMPAMLFSGVMGCIRTILFSPLRLLLLIAAILLLVFAPATVLTVVSLLGAGGVVWQTLWHEWNRRKKTDGDA